MNETGFYALASRGAEPARVAAVARHLPSAVAYVSNDSAVKAIFRAHGIKMASPCVTPNCAGISRAEVYQWLLTRNPDRLVMVDRPYGAYTNDALPYLERRQRPTYFLSGHVADDTVRTDLFKAVLKADRSGLAGIDLYPILPHDPDELPTRAQVRTELGGQDRPLVLIIGDGITPDVRSYTIRLCEQRGIDHATVTSYPVMGHMVGADLVVGYAGYNQTLAEAVGVTMAGVANFNDPTQQWRVNTTPQSLADTITNLEIRDPGPVNFTNHARRAAALIAGHESWEDVDG